MVGMGGVEWRTYGNKISPGGGGGVEQAETTRWVAWEQVVEAW